MSAAISTECFFRRLSPFGACLTPEFYQRAVAGDGSVALLRNPLQHTLDSFPFTLRTSRPSRGCAVIHISRAETPPTYPFCLLNARMCTELRALVENIAMNDTSVSTIALLGEGRGFLVAPQLSFLSKLCIGQAPLTLEDTIDKTSIAGGVLHPSLEERTRDYTDLFHAFIKLHACLNFENQEAYFSSINRMRERFLFIPTGEEHSHAYSAYVNEYCDRLIANVPVNFSSQLLVAGVNGMAFGLGTLLAQSAEVAFGNRHTAWDCPSETHALVTENVTQGTENRHDTRKQLTHFATVFPETFLTNVHRSVVRRDFYGGLAENATPNARPPDALDTEPHGDTCFLSAAELQKVGDIADHTLPLHRFASAVVSRATEIARLGQPKVQKLKRYLRRTNFIE